MNNFDYDMEFNVSMKTTRLVDTQHNRDMLCFELDRIEHEVVDRVRAEIWHLKMQIVAGRGGV